MAYPVAWLRELLELKLEQYFRHFEGLPSYNRKLFPIFCKENKPDERPVIDQRYVWRMMLYWRPTSHFFLRCLQLLQACFRFVTEAGIVRVGMV